MFFLDNFISELKREDLHSLGTSLKSLDLSGNSLTSVPEAIFWDLQRLEVLDLSRNNIIQIHSMAFQNGVSYFSHLNNSYVKPWTTLEEDYILTWGPVLKPV